MCSNASMQIVRDHSGSEDREFSASITLTLVQCGMVPYPVQRNHCHVPKRNQNIHPELSGDGFTGMADCQLSPMRQKQIQTIQHKITTSHDIITPHNKTILLLCIWIKPQILSTPNFFPYSIGFQIFVPPAPDTKIIWHKLNKYLMN